MTDQVSDQISLKPGQSIRTYAWLIALIGLMALLGSGVAYLLNSEWALAAQIGAGLGLLLLLGAALLRPDAVQTALIGRSVKYGSHAVLLSLIFIAILAVINYLGLQYNQEYDLTETGDFTLSEQTIQILQNLDRPVRVIGFFQAGDPRSIQARTYLERYSTYTDRLTHEFHDPNVEPTLAQSFDLTNYGLVFVSGDTHYEMAGTDEQSITSGLVRVTSDEQKKIYFITGQGERSIDDSGQEGYSTIKQALERENYLVHSLNLSASSTTIPADASVLVLARPEHDLPAVAIQLISDWFSAGGKLMILTDPLIPTPLTEMLQTYGLGFGNDFVVDISNSLVTLDAQNQVAQQVTTPIVVEYPFHEITDRLNGFQAYFPFVRSVMITPTAEVSSKTTLPLLVSSLDSWAETNLEAVQPEYNEGVDFQGPVTMGAAAEDSQSGARLVVFGNSSFAANQHISPQVANLDLFMNSVNWLAEEEELISIRPKEPTNRRLFLTPLQNSLTILTTLVVIPLSVFAAGAAVWWKRR